MYGGEELVTPPSVHHMVKTTKSIHGLWHFVPIRGTKTMCGRRFDGFRRYRAPRKFDPHECCKACQKATKE